MIEKNKKKATVLVGERIKELRKQSTLSQEQLAVQAGLTTSYIGMLERGLKSPTVDTLEKIAIALEVEIEELFRFPGKPFESSTLRRLAERMEKRSMDESDMLYDIMVKIMQLKDYKSE